MEAVFPVERTVGATSEALEASGRPSQLPEERERNESMRNSRSLLTGREVARRPSRLPHRCEAEVMDPEYADQLIVQLLQGRLSPAEQKALTEWRQASPGNESRFRDVEAVWRSLGVIEGPRRAGRPSASAVIAEASQSRSATSEGSADAQSSASEVPAQKSAPNSSG